MVKDVLETVLLVAGTALEGVLVGLMLFRGFYKKLPYFFTYIAYDVANTLVLWGLQKHHPVAYFHGYWYGEIVSWVLILAVIYEIYASLLKEYTSLQKLGAILFWFMGVVLVLVAFWTAFNSPGSDTLRFIRAVLTLERSMRIVQAGLLMVLFVFASFFGLSWKNYLFGIALGLSIFIFAELAIVAVRTFGGKAQNLFYVLLKPASYDLAALVWMVYLVKSWQAKDLPALPRTQLVEWNDTLQELLHR
jgi:hypothetical protein